MISHSCIWNVFGRPWIFKNGNTSSISQSEAIGPSLAVQCIGAAPHRMQKHGPGEHTRMWMQLSWFPNIFLCFLMAPFLILKFWPGSVARCPFEYSVRNSAGRLQLTALNVSLSGSRKDTCLLHPPFWSSVWFRSIFLGGRMFGL